MNPTNNEIIEQFRAFELVGKLPEHMGLRAVLYNDLYGAMDHFTEFQPLLDAVNHVHDNLPSESYGSTLRVGNWTRMGGANGIRLSSPE